MDFSDSTSFLSELKSNPEKIAALLDQCQWNPDLSWEQLLRVAKHFKALHANKGEAILHEGFHDTSIAVIARGSVNIIKKDSHEHDRTIATIGTGKTLGEMSFVDGEPRSANCIAAADTVILVLTKAEFEQLLIDCPKLACRIVMRISRTLSQRLRKASGQLIEYIS